MPTGAAAAGDGEAASEEPKEEKTSFDVKLAKFNPPDKIKVRKETPLHLQTVRDPCCC